MARKRTVGYVQLEWTCPNCNSRNPGGKKTCQSCGAPQPENVQFQRAADEKLLKEQQAIQAAAAGADIHCGFCGTRNPATATTCSQCGGDLKEGQRRQAGAKLAAAQASAVVVCTNCGTENQASESMCQKCGAALPSAQKPGAPLSFSAPMAASPAPAAGSAAKPARKLNWALLGGIGAVLLLVCCIAGYFMFFTASTSLQGTVTNVYWQTAVPVQEQQEVRYNDKAGSPPGEAYDVSCHTETEEVCEQKTIDQGNGYGEVVEECHDVSTEYCSYTVLEWQTVETLTQQGSDLFPEYSSPNVRSGQRLGSASEDLTVTFSTEKGEITYSPDDVTEFQQFAPGSVWTLKLNALGSVIDVER